MNARAFKRRVYAMRERGGLRKVMIHVTPKINEECDHSWNYFDGEPDGCTHCGLSFTRYAFSMP